MTDKQQLTEVTRNLMMQHGATQHMDAKNIEGLAVPEDLKKALRSATGGGQTLNTSSATAQQDTMSLIKELFQAADKDGKSYQDVVRDVLKEAQERKSVQQPGAVGKTIRHTEGTVAKESSAQQQQNISSDSTSQFKPHR